MTDNQVDRMRELLTDAVSDVEPAHRLDEIRARTARPSRRFRWYAAGGVGLAAAAAVTAVAVITHLADSEGPGPAPSPSHGVEVKAAPAYFVGETPHGLRLFREFISIEASVPDLDASLDALERGPDDPDYTSLWGPDSFDRASVEGDVIYVDLSDEALHDRPPGMTEEEAGLAIEQVILTAQAALGQGRMPVQFRLNGNPTDEVYGEPTSEPVGNHPRFSEVLALVNISDPAEAQTVHARFRARGVASSFEATVPWQVRDADGDVVEEGFATADGWIPGVLHPWETEVDVSGLEPGTYTFVAMTADPSGGAEGAGPTSDTRTIVVE